MQHRRLSINPIARPFATVALTAWAAIFLSGCFLFGSSGKNVGGVKNPSTGKEQRARSTQKSKVAVGLEVLAADQFAAIRGKKIALLTHSAAVDQTGKSALELISASAGNDLVRVILPSSGYDPAGQDRNPPPVNLLKRSSGGSIPVSYLSPDLQRLAVDQLDKIDALVIDLQDSGVRFSVHATALAVMMEQCYLAKIKIIVLDRPNPLGGLRVAGPLPDPALYGSLRSYYPLPLQHGMTLGELAQMYNGFFGIGADLQVIAMKGWSRTDTWDKTDREWRAPSADVPSGKAALLISALAPLVAGGLSSGAGAPVSGTVFGSPDLNVETILPALQQEAALRDWQFTATQFTPTGGNHSGKLCRGIQISPAAKQQGDPVILLYHVIQQIHTAQPNALDFQQIYPVLGSSAVIDALTKKRSPSRIVQLYNDSIVAFQTERFKALIYKN